MHIRADELGVGTVRGHAKIKLPVYREVMGERFFGAGILLTSYGASLTEIGRHEEARTALEEARSILVESFDEGHWRVKAVDDARSRLEARLRSEDA